MGTKRTVSFADEQSIIMVNYLSILSYSFFNSKQRKLEHKMYLICFSALFFSGATLICILICVGPLRPHISPVIISDREYADKGDPPRECSGA